ncbi:MAG: prenyltransferase/squalene oxidase repeat-containing protein [Methanolobus sp.]|nr:prenyltransferase/squalene oxidase repeat-containing protein [Methanolobus sp.]
MYKKICVFAIIIFISIPSGCFDNSSSSTQVNLQKENFNEVWSLETVKRIENSQGVDGGYSDFPPETPTLYSTYYFLASLELLNKEPKYKQQTINWLLSKEKELIEQQNSSSIRDIYFLTMSLDMLDLKPSNSSNMVSKVMKLQISDGSFANKIGDKGTLLDTYRAVVILNKLGIDLGTIPKTKEWLVSMWMDKKINDNLVYSFDEALLLESALELYDFDITSPENAGYRMKTIGKQTDTIKDEINLTSKNEIDLFTLNTFSEILLRSDNIDSESSSIINLYLKEKQLKDGGFNAFLGTYGESQGTYLALKISSNFGVRTNEDVIYEFISKHELPDGGFRPAFRLISSNENTYLAVQSLKILGSEPSDELELKKYLENQWITDENSAKDVYYLLMTYQILDQTPPDKANIKEWVESNFVKESSQSPNTIDLKKILYLSKIANIVGIQINDKETIISKIQLLQNEDGGFGIETSDIFTTFFALEILDELNAYPLKKESCVAWINKGQNTDGGFVIRRGNISTNSSDIYSTYLSVLSLENLNSSPQNIQGVTEWLQDCKDDTGGFRFAPEYAELDASPDTFEESLEYTAWGLMTMETLKNESGDIGILSLQYSESVNKDLGPHKEQYRQDFPVGTGANKIEVRLRVTEFDLGDYGKIYLKLYNNNDQLVASDMFYPFEKYINVDYTGNMSAGDWHMVVSVEEDLGLNTINVAGNINIFGSAVHSTVEQ